ncbi:MAG: type IV secretion system DNA-binding domain-containing protein [Pseudomonadota bacterium]
MALDRKRFGYGKADVVRDIRPLYVRFGDAIQRPAYSLTAFIMGASSYFFVPEVANYFGDLIFIIYMLFFWWLVTRDRSLPGKLPVGAPYQDRNNMGPGKSGEAEGILFIGNDKKTKQQIWYSNSDARTHILYLGTTGSGKTEGLKSFVTSALSWGSGFVYIDGKADTDLWSSLSSLVRRFGRDDDLLVLNYMTGNSDGRSPSNTLNPFSSGSASYLTQMLVSLMPEAEGDNAMWKERAVSLMSALMPALTWKRDNQDFPLSVNSIRTYLGLKYVIMVSRDETIPEKIREGLVGYLETLPGYIPEAFDDQGKEKPMGPDQPMVDTNTIHQQHGYLTMQFTRALQSLGDDYGYIFETAAADIDMVDIVLNRRILITLIPALEKSGDETANLGKIIAATIKGMMGSTLGSNLEGESSTIIENKPTHSATPFMTVFDEVGYYTAQGMAVMAAQARSLGFCLVFSAQDLQAMEKRVKEEARSITANCNIKIFGKLQDPTQTREFFENHIGKDYIAKVSSLQVSGSMSTGSYHDTQQASIETGTRADYDDLKDMKEGEAIVSFAMDVLSVNIFYSNPGHAKAMRVTRYLPLPPPDDNIVKHADQITKLRDALVNKTWTAEKADVALDTPKELELLSKGFDEGEKGCEDLVDHGVMAIAALHAELYPTEAQDAIRAVMNPTPAATPAPAPQVHKEETQTPVVPPMTTTEQAPIPTTSTPPLVTEPAAPDTNVAQTIIEKPKAAIKKLGSDAEKILSDAGTSLRNSLFQSGKETPDAAE